MAPVVSRVGITAAMGGHGAAELVSATVLIPNVQLSVEDFSANMAMMCTDDRHKQIIKLLQEGSPTKIDKVPLVKQVKPAALKSVLKRPKMPKQAL